MEKFIKFLGLCVCTEEECIEEDVLKLLHYFNSEDKKLEEIFTQVGKTTFYLLANKMDDFNLIEHGTSIRFSWLTPAGKELLENLMK